MSHVDKEFYMKKMVHLFGSPRVKGNSADIANVFCKKAESYHVEITTYTLNKMKYKGCQACDACKNGHHQCTLYDDLLPALTDIVEADVVLMTSPVYFGDVTAQLKAVIDRFYSFYVPRYWKESAKSRLFGDKAMVMLLPQGAIDKNRFSDIGPRYKEFFTELGFNNVHILRAVGVYFPGQALENQKVLDDATKLAENMFGKT